MNVYFVRYQDGGYQPAFTAEGDAYVNRSWRTDFITCCTKKRVVELVREQFPDSSKFQIKLLGTAS